MTPETFSFLDYFQTRAVGIVLLNCYLPPSYLKIFIHFQRDKTRTVTYRVPPNSAVQVYDHRKQDSRVVFGPNLV